VVTRLLVPVLFLVLSSPLAAQAPIPGAPRETSAKEPTGIIRGRAVLAEAGQSVARVRVLLTGPTGNTRATMTDENGRYEFRAVPAGPFEMRAVKGGFVVLSATSRRRVEQRRSISLKEGETIDKTDFTLVRGGVLTGRVVDEAGEGVTGAWVQLMKPQSGSASRAVGNIPGAGTDDRGEFRVHSIPPGDYVLSVAFQENAFGDSPDDPLQYARTYYPGTIAIAEAQRITVPPGTEIAGLTLALQRARMSRVRGIVSSPNSRPIGVIVSLSSRDRDGAGFNQTALADAEGNFSIAGVPPGTYRIVARSEFSGDGDRATVDVTVGNADVTGVALMLRPGVKARGRIAFDLPRPDIRPGDIRVVARPDDEEMHFSSGSLPPPVREDWTFELGGLSGRTTLTAGVLRADARWIVKSIRLGDMDVTDSGIEFQNDDVDGIEIILTDKAASITGTVTDGDKPIGNAVVIVYPDSAEQWRARTRYFAVDRTDQAGHYSIPLRPAARYRVIALDDLEPNEEFDEGLLRELSDRATVIDLREGEARALNLKLQEK
jgi:hypothetical protein